MTNKPPTAIKIIKSKIDLSVFTFKKVRAKAIEGNNNIILGIIDSYHFFKQYLLLHLIFDKSFLAFLFVLPLI